MIITENDLKTVTNIISYHFNVILSGWYYQNTVSQLDYVYEIVTTDINNHKNEYRVLININDKCLRFEYIDNKNCDIVNLMIYSIDTWYYSNNIVEQMTILIISILNYYMQFKKLTIVNRK